MRSFERGTVIHIVLRERIDRSVLVVVFLIKHALDQMRIIIEESV